MELEIHESWKAIAAMARNRVIGAGNRIPWHLPEDFKWFRECTLGNVIVMGRKTFEALGRPLPDRMNIVLTRQPPGAQERSLPILGTTPTGQAETLPGNPDRSLPPGWKNVWFAPSLEAIARTSFPGTLYICGGAEIYTQALPHCSELLLTRVHLDVAGDRFFPAFEHLFDHAGTIREEPKFTIERWLRRSSIAPARQDWEPRQATAEDIPCLERLIPYSARSLQAGHYSQAEIDAALGPVFGVDRQLIADGTYYVVEIERRVVGCGGWSKRHSLFGGGSAEAGPDQVLEPGRDPARVRAFFVDPQWARRGIARRILFVCETAMRQAGFRTAELVATLPGEPFYAAAGWTPVDRMRIPSSNGLTLPVVRMTKTLD